jgi:hypothetical protein
MGEDRRLTSRLMAVRSGLGEIDSETVIAGRGPMEFLTLDRIEPERIGHGVNPFR